MTDTLIRFGLGLGAGLLIVGGLAWLADHGWDRLVGWRVERRLRQRIHADAQRYAAEQTQARIQAGIETSWDMPARTDDTREPARRADR